MNKITLLMLGVLAILLCANPTTVFGQSPHNIHTHSHASGEPCGAEALHNWMMENKTEYAERHRKAKEKPISASGPLKGNRTIGYKIPVVFHLITTDAANSISVGDCNGFIADLNSVFNNSNISFCLAQNVPGTGTWNTYWSSNRGITYSWASHPDLTTFDYTNVNTIVQFATLGIADFLDQNYLNIYITDDVVIGGLNVLGASSQGVSGFEPGGIAIEFGALASAGGLDVLIHEIGHWLNLAHVFGPSDGICDTWNDPSLSGNLGSCPGNSLGTHNCTGSLAAYSYLNGENFMDYSSCTNRTFTTGQFDVMYDCLDNQRPLIHSDFNLVNTGVGTNANFPICGGASQTANFSLSETDICAGNTIRLIGANNMPAVTTLVYETVNPANDPNVLFGATGVVAGLPFQEVTFLQAGTYSIFRRDIASVNPLASSNTVQITVSDCSAGNFRLRTNHLYDESVGMAGLSIDDVYDNNGDVIGHIVAGSSVPNNQTSSIIPRESGVIMRVDPLGNRVWQKVVEEGDNLRLFDVQSGVEFHGEPNLYAFTGYVNRGQETKLLFFIMDGQGNIRDQTEIKIEKSQRQSDYFDFSVGLRTIQIDGNGNFVIVGFAGDGSKNTDEKEGFVLCLENAPGFPRLWTQNFWGDPATGLPPPGGEDVDAMNVVAEYEDWLLVGGTLNTTLPDLDASAYLTYLDKTSGSMRTILGTPVELTITADATKLCDAAFHLSENRLYVSTMSRLDHGTTIFELDVDDLSILNRTSTIFRFNGVDLDVDENYQKVVIAGRYVESAFSNAVVASIDFPAFPGAVWPSNTLTIRAYDNTGISNLFAVNHGDDFSWNVDAINGQDVFERFLYTPELLTFSPLGFDGYMTVYEVDVPSPVPSGSNASAVTFNKLDLNLRSACDNTPNFQIDYLTFPNQQAAVNYLATFDPNEDTLSLRINPLPIPCDLMGCIPNTNIPEYPIEIENDPNNLFSSNEYSTAISTNTNGELANIGYFQADSRILYGTAALLMNDPNCGSDYTHSVYVSKFGGCRDWVYPFPNCINFDEEHTPDVEINSYGEVYAAFNFTGTFSLTVNGMPNSYGSNGKTDIALIKFTADGEILWCQTFGGAGFDYINDIELYSDASGDYIYLGGMIIGTSGSSANFNSGNSVSYLSGTSICSYCIKDAVSTSGTLVGSHMTGNVFVAQLKESPTVHNLPTTVWAKGLGVLAIGAKIDASNTGDVYVMGAVNANDNAAASSPFTVNPSHNYNRSSLLRDDVDYFMVLFKSNGAVITNQTYGSDDLDAVLTNADYFTTQPYSTLYNTMSQLEFFRDYDIEYNDVTAELYFVFPSGAWLGNNGPATSNPYYSYGGTHLVQTTNLGILSWTTPLVDYTKDSGPFQRYGNYTNNASIAFKNTNEVIVNGHFMLSASPTIAHGYDRLNFDRFNPIMEADMDADGNQRYLHGYFTAAYDPSAMPYISTHLFYSPPNWTKVNTSYTAVQFPNDSSQENKISVTDIDINKDPFNNYNEAIYSTWNLNGRMEVVTNSNTHVLEDLSHSAYDGYIVRSDAGNGNYYRPAPARGEVASTASIQLYPNPAIHSIQLGLSGELAEQVVQIQILDIQGRVLYQGDKLDAFSSIELDLSQLAEGMYIVKVMDQNGKYYSEKFVKHNN